MPADSMAICRPPFELFVLDFYRHRLLEEAEDRSERASPPLGSVQKFSHIQFRLSGARNWLKL